MAELVCVELDQTERELRSIEAGNRVRRDHKQSISEKNVELAVLQRKVISNDMDVEVFLTRATSLCRGYNQWLVKNVNNHYPAAGNSDEELDDQDEDIDEIQEETQSVPQEEALAMPEEVDFGLPHDDAMPQGDAQAVPQEEALTLPEEVALTLPEEVALGRRYTRSQARQDAARAREEPLTEQNEDISTDRACRVCLGNAKCMVLIPCGHANLCQECAKFAKRDKKCPTCRQKVSKILKVFDN